MKEKYKANTSVQGRDDENNRRNKDKTEKQIKNKQTAENTVKGTEDEKKRNEQNK